MCAREKKSKKKVFASAILSQTDGIKKSAENTAVIPDAEMEAKEETEWRYATPVHTYTWLATPVHTLISTTGRPIK